MQSGERFQTQRFLQQKQLKAHPSSITQVLGPEEYLWVQESEPKVWWLTRQEDKIKYHVPEWKKRFMMSLT